MRVLVLGVTGMLGYAVFHTFRENVNIEVWGTLRNMNELSRYPSKIHSKLIHSVDVLDQDSLLNVFNQIKPHLIINCVGLIKQRGSAKDPLFVLPLNAIFPHRLAKLCALSQSRIIHISTDCVFSGRKGAYLESDLSDAEDLYGKSKFIGELTDLPHAITIRTSIIGHEYNSNYSLIDWFLSQTTQVKGYVNAIYSGIPTIELAHIIRDYIAPNKNLSGLYHVASKPINKYDLLRLVAEIYGKKIIIIPDEQMVVDRSLNSEQFSAATGYVAPSWPQLIERMYQSYNLYRGAQDV